MSQQFEFGGDIVWRPSQEDIEHARLTAFMREHDLESFDELMQRSTDDVAWFTESVLDFLDIQFYEPYSQVVDLSGGIERPEWVVGGRMNIVHNLLDKYLGTEAESNQALIWEGEEGPVRTFSYAELNAEVCRCANALRSLGLGKGDAIGLYMPMTPEIVIALLAIAKIGGIILPLFSGYGRQACITRLIDADAKALFVSDGAYRRGKVVPMKPTADKASEDVPTLEHMIVLERCSNPIEMQAGRDHYWHDLVPAQPAEAPTERTMAEDTLMVIYTSGTTGRPKGARHTHAGFPIKGAQDMAFGTDVHAGDVIYWMTDMGWMMGPWLVFGSLTLGATMFIYDGAPDFPAPDRLWHLVERHQINQLGVSPTLIRALIPHGESQFETKDLTSIRCFASTGEPWNPAPWMWLFERVGGGTRPIINYSGGTEISGGIVMGNPILPLKPCGFSGPCPGIAADVLDENGESVVDEVGELVIKAPWIGMTRGFWRDEERYHQTYWARWDDTWVHGDFAAIDSDGIWYILGRSDDTIKIAGKRLGPAEVESILVAHPAVVEAAAIGVPHEVKGSELVVFCVLAPDFAHLHAASAPDSASDEGSRSALLEELRQAIIDAMGKPLSPKQIHTVSDIPKTRNGKVMRRMARAAFLGLDPGDTSSLVNISAVDEIAALE